MSPTPRPSSPPVPPGEIHSFARAADGTRLFVRHRDGQHPASQVRAILCDGILCDGFIWKYLWEDLARYAKVAHWHYRGHGRSAPPADPERIDITAHADDLMAVRVYLGEPACVLVGHSMGCQVALECYRRFPDKVKGLVLVCGSFGNLTATFHGGPILEMVLPKVMELATKAPEVIRAIWSRVPPEMALKIALRAGEIDPDKVRAEDMLPYLKHMTHVDFPMFLRMLRAAGEHSAESFLGEVKVPVLVVAGEKDTFTPPFLAESIVERIPGAELLMVTKGTHVAPIEQPELVNARIETFFRERVGV